MGWTWEQFVAYERRTQHHRAGACPRHQELKAPVPGSVGDQARIPKVDEKSHPSYRVAITLRYSDLRRRDMDNATATLLDCVKHAVGRLMDMDTRNNRESNQSP